MVDAFTFLREEATKPDVTDDRLKFLITEVYNFLPPDNRRVFLNGLGITPDSRFGPFTGGIDYDQRMDQPGGAKLYQVVQMYKLFHLQGE